MASIFRIGFPTFAILVVLYIIGLVVMRRVHRKRLEARWEQSGSTEDRDEFVRLGMESMDARLNVILSRLIYILPLAFAAFVVYAVITAM